MGTKPRNSSENSLPNIEESLKYMYQHSMYCDVTVQATDVKEGSSMCFKAHKLILATRSFVFADMFFKTTRNNNILPVKCSPGAFDIFLWYIYTDTIEADDVDELLEAFEMATTYRVFSFWNICAEKIYEKSSNINKRNVCSVMKIATDVKSSILQKLCLSIIKEDLESIFLSDGFLNLNENTVWDLLKESKLNVCPKNKLKTIVKWMISKKVKNMKFLSFIDFSDISAGDFLHIVEQFPSFFSGSEIRVFLSQLTLADRPNLQPDSKTDTGEKSPRLFSLYEGMQFIKSCATKVQTVCNQSFSKITMHSLSDFEQEMLLKIDMKYRTLKLVMIELAFGSEFVPPNCLVVKLFSNLNSQKKLKALKYHLIPSLEHYYLLVDYKRTFSLNCNFNLLLAIKAFGLLNWGSHGPVSNQKFRVATVPDSSKIKTINTGIVKVARLRTFLDWLLFINPSNEEKKFIISTLFFDTHENIIKYLKHLEIYEPDDEQ